MNRTTVTIAGNITQEPRLCFGKESGQPFAVLRVAVNDNEFDRNDQTWRQTRTTFYELVCFGAIGAHALASFSVGDPVLATGRFSVREWQGESTTSMTPTLHVDTLGPDLRFGRAPFTRGRVPYPESEDRVAREVGPRDVGPQQARDRAPGAASEQGADIPTDANGEVTDDAVADAVLADG